MIKRLITALADRTGNLALYRKARPSGREFAAFYKRHNIFHSMGESCYISAASNITDPALVRLGNNVQIGDCSIFCHDGSINVINDAFGLRLDSVGKVDIKDNVFIAHGAIIQPGVTIGSNVIIGAGCVISRNVPPNSIMIGSPARRVGALTAHVANMKRRSATYPWIGLVQQRASEWDPDMEPELVRQRVAFFYP